MQLLRKCIGAFTTRFYHFAGTCARTLITHFLDFDNTCARTLPTRFQDFDNTCARTLPTRFLDFSDTCIRTLITHFQNFDYGKKEGYEQGAFEKSLEAARNMLAENVSEDVISRYTGLPVEKVRELAEQLQVAVK